MAGFGPQDGMSVLGASLKTIKSLGMAKSLTAHWRRRWVYPEGRIL